MAQNMNVVAAAASLGAPPRRHRGDPSEPSGPGGSGGGQQSSGGGGAGGGGGGTSISARYGENEWEARESQRQRELEEARARAAQMEKTMKWWSDCTANWREKWSKVRTERNKARDESKQLRSSLETAVKEANAYKREKSELEQQIGQLKKEMEKVHMLMMKHAGQFHNKSDGTDEPERDGRDVFSPDISSDGLKNVNSEDGLVIKSEADRSGDTRDMDIEEYILQGAVPKHVLDSLKDDDRRASAEERRLIQQLSKDDFDEEYLTRKITALQQRLNDAHITIESERDEREVLYKKLDKLANDLQDARDKCEELRGAKQDAVRELLTLQEQQRAEVRILNNALHEEQQARESLDRRMGDLRAELERLQAENAAEWGKRERLESEKLALERDNKKLRTEVREFQAEQAAQRRGAGGSSAGAAANLSAIGHGAGVSGQTDAAAVRAMQQELAERNKELSDARHAHSKLKKLLAETNTELGHAGRRAEQYETEVKRLRGRVEELKRELAGAEDELDSACSHVRRLQRNNEELLAQTDSMQAQLNGLGAGGITSRLSLLESPNRREPSPGERSYSPFSEQFTAAYHAAAIEVGGGHYGRSTIDELRQMFDKNRYEYKRHYMPKSSANYQSVSASCGPSSESRQAAFADAKQSSLDESIFEAQSGAAAPPIGPRNVDFERAKQKFDKPTSLRLNTASQNALHNQPPPPPSATSAGSRPSQSAGMGHFQRLSHCQGLANATRHPVDAAAAKAAGFEAVDGGGGAGGVGEGRGGSHSNGAGGSGGTNAGGGGGGGGVVGESSAEPMSGKFYNMNTSMNLDELKVSDDDTS